MFASQNPSDHFIYYITDGSIFLHCNLVGIWKDAQASIVMKSRLLHPYLFSTFQISCSMSAYVVRSVMFWRGNGKLANGTFG